MMLIGEIVAKLRAERGWGLEETAAAVRAAGARNVQYQHIQQLEQFPKRTPRYLVNLARAFGMSAEEFLNWTPTKPRVVKEETLPYAPDLAANIREISLALVAIGGWVHSTRPAEAPLLAAELRKAAKKLGGPLDSSLIGILVDAVSGRAPSATREEQKSARRNNQG